MTETPKTENWQVEVKNLLTRAAALCADNEADLDSFIRAAYSAYFEVRPGLREWLEEMQLRAHLDEVRQTGRMAQA